MRAGSTRWWRGTTSRASWSPRLGDRAVTSPQNPVVIRPRSEPQPDMLVLRPREVSYSRAHPTPEDVLLAIEVADTTTRFDGIVKARLYARARIREYWLVDVGREGRRVP